MSDTVAKEPLHTRVAGWLERAFNPIMVKELRASMRGTRFFIAHLTILCLFATGLLVAFAAMMASEGYGRPRASDPSAVGLSVYLVTQLLQLAVVFLVVPGLAASSVTSEREALTYELLLSSTLAARQIIWGKFTAAMVQTFILFVSMVPMVGLCFLFGGVTLHQIVANYVFLFALSALMVMCSLSVSASSQSTQRAVGSVYAMALAASAAAGWLIWLAFDEREFDELVLMAVAYGFVPESAEDLLRRPADLFDRAMYVHAIPGFLWASLFALFFINATNRLKPLHANRSTPLRIHYLATLAGMASLTLVSLYVETPPESMGAMARSEAVTALTLALSTFLFLGALFACEDPVLPPGLARKAARKRGLLRLLEPGSGSGAAFCVCTAATLLAGCFLALLPYIAGFEGGAWKVPPSWLLATAFVCALLWTFFCAMLARFLSLILPGRPVLIRGLLVVTGGVLTVFPIIHHLISRSIEGRHADPWNLHGPVTLALSPVAAIFATLDLSGPRSFPLHAAGVPVPALFALFTLGAGLALLVFSKRAMARLRRGEAAP